ncbi:MAG: hypothetical protein OXQ28_14000 [Acidobacteriota bacterium]|nr:hypothetical protein [Acidobacteriota bacterium]
MASMRGANRDAERLTAAECDRRALAALAKAGYSGLSAAHVGYRIWPDRRFDARGAGLAAIRVLRRLEKAGKVSQTWMQYNARWFAIRTPKSR